jgi:hypothetical protein
MLTLGVGLMTGNPLGVIVGLVGYVLGWLYLPDSRWFVGKLEARQQAASSADEARAVEAFAQKRRVVFEQLSGQARQRYRELQTTCADIEASLAEDSQPDDPRLRKLDDFMWNYLRLLALEEKLKAFLEEEPVEDIRKQLEGARQDLERARVDAAKPDALDSQKRILQSKTELVQLLEQRVQKVEQARGNIQLAQTEQQRLEQQIKLIRGDLLANRRTDALSDRISSAVDHFNETNKWMQQMDEFKAVVGEEIPATASRVGFRAPEPAAGVPLPPPPLPQRQRVR